MLLILTPTCIAVLLAVYGSKSGITKLNPATEGGSGETIETLSILFAEKPRLSVTLMITETLSLIGGITLFVDKYPWNCTLPLSCLHATFKSPPPTVITGFKA